LENSTPRSQSPSASKAFTVSKITGIIFILVAAVIAIFIQCPSKAQYFLIYALVGVGIALLLAKSAEKSTATVKVTNITIALAGGVALPFILFFTNPIGSFKPDNCDLISITVFVHGKKGPQDMILRQQGHVVMDHKGERKKAFISENGEAYFNNLHIGDEVKLNIDFSEPYKSVNPDSVYIIQTDGRIYLPVALKGIDKIKGIVMYDEAPLEGVVVKTGSLIDTTDQYGGFDISVPEALQAQEYKIWFIKKAFKTRSVTAHPQTGDDVEIMMEK
jgi:hypothetical protein